MNIILTVLFHIFIESNTISITILNLNTQVAPFPECSGVSANIREWDIIKPAVRMERERLQLFIFCFCKLISRTALLEHVASKSCNCIGLHCPTQSSHGLEQKFIRQIGLQYDIHVHFHLSW